MRPRAPVDAPIPSDVRDFLASSEGLAFAKAFLRIEDPQLRRAIVRLVEALVPESA